VTASPKVLEKNFWADWVKPRLARQGVLAERVENLAGSGTPDVGAIRDGTVLKVELKTCARPARPSTPLRVEVKPTQPAWHARWARAGGLSVWLVQVGSGPHARRYALPGPLGERLAAGLTEAELAELGAEVRGDSVFGELVSVARGGLAPAPSG
jgi:hypothetical protein